VMMPGEEHRLENDGKHTEKRGRTTASHSKPMIQYYITPASSAAARQSVISRLGGATPLATLSHWLPLRRANSADRCAVQGRD
jgi:hypothetical protein